MPAMEIVIRPTRYPPPMPKPSVMMSVASVGRTAWPSAVARRFTPLAGPSARTTSCFSITVSGSRGSSWPSRNSARTRTP